MNWFKKSIAFDQKKKLLILSLMMIIPIIFNSISIAVIFSNRKSNTGWVPSFSYNGIDVLIILMVAFITVVSIGLRDRSEKGFITSMPMKKEDVLFTKMACSTIAVIIPIIIGFIVDTSIYLSNREV
ncbi:MAG: hypothetical protein RR515_03980, partial [Clostridium sp.]